MNVRTKIIIHCIGISVLIIGIFVCTVAIYERRIDNINSRSAERIAILEESNQFERKARERAEQDASGIRTAYSELAGTMEQRQGTLNERQKQLEQAQELNRKLIQGTINNQNTTAEIWASAIRLETRLSDIRKAAESIQESN